MTPVYTIGHSNHDLKTFLALLKTNAIQLVVDVRSKPYSKYAGQFNKDVLEATLNEDGLDYLFLGRELGGIPHDAELYDNHGRVLYGPLSQSEAFGRGLATLRAALESGKSAALLCGEENPIECHRRLLVGSVLAGMGYEIMHIRADGSVVSEQALAGEAGEQLTLPMEGAKPWISPKPVRKEPPSDS